MVVRETDWVSAHIFYHENLDPVLLEFVSPLVRELAIAGRSQESFFLRHWDGGNHVRLRLLAPRAVHGEIRTLVQQRWAEFVRIRPAPRAAAPTEYIEVARRLASVEGVATYARHPYPNNSVEFIPYRREYDRYGRGRSMLAVEQHFTESSRLALRTMEAGMSPAQRDTVALSLVVLTWLCGAAGHPLPTRQPSEWMTMPDAEQRYRRQKETVGEIVKRMWAVATQRGDRRRDSVFTEWTRTVGRLRSQLGTSASTSRVLDVCAHLVCNRLGVTLDSEAYLRYLAARGLASSPVRYHWAR